MRSFIWLKTLCLFKTHVSLFKTCNSRQNMGVFLRIIYLNFQNNVNQDFSDFVNNSIEIYIPLFKSLSLYLKHISSKPLCLYSNICIYILKTYILILKTDLPLFKPVTIYSKFIFLSSNRHIFIKTNIIDTQILFLCFRTKYIKSKCLWFY